MNRTFSHWVLENWSRAGLVTAVVLVSLAPLVYVRTGVPQLLIFLWLPFYMLHQFEEHGQGTLLEFYRRMMPHIAPNLTERKLLVVNLGTVWLFFVGSIYAAFYNQWSLALYPPYLSLVNAVMHMGQLIAWRTYNPGLWTALVLFIPGAIYTIHAVTAIGATLNDNLVAFALAVLVHAFFFALGKGWIARRL
jgi:hypothetical protein